VVLPSVGSMAGQCCRRPEIVILRRGVAGCSPGSEGGFPGIATETETPQPGCLRHFGQSTTVRASNRVHEGLLSGTNLLSGNRRRRNEGLVLAPAREYDGGVADRFRRRGRTQANDAMSCPCVRVLLRRRSHRRFHGSQHVHYEG
jgi:hypothetical protein